MAVTVTLALAQVGGFLNRIRDPKPALRQVGEIGVSLSQRSFDDQKLGEHIWAARYPDQPEPKVNIAGLVGDLSRGASIKARRFQDRPALRDTGILQQSIASRIVSKTEVEWGSVVPYASLHQHGGTSTQAITPAIRQGLAKFLKSKRGKPFRPQLGFLFQLEALETRVGARPFVGITEEGERDIRDSVEAWAAKEATDNGDT